MTASRFTLAAALALLAAGCGTSAPPPAAPGPAASADAGGVAFARCMRDAGFDMPHPQFGDAPDPDSEGGGRGPLANPPFGGNPVTRRSRVTYLRDMLLLEGSPRPRPRVGLVLGAGGITAIAWMIGALDALREHTGWSPAEADVIAGTSAGAVVGTVLASGQDPLDLLRYAEDDAALAEQVRLATAGRPKTARRLPLPGSIGIGVKGLLASCPHQRIASLAGFLPTGQRSTDEIRGLTHEAARGGWPAHPQLWLHACDYRTGERVTFGRAGAPEAELADAVAASAAVPGYYRPVAIGGRLYVDGGVCSLSNLDGLAGAGCDLVICLSPFSSRERGPALGGAVYGAFRGVTGMRLEREARTLRAAGTRVVTLEPSAHDLRAMGLNPMDRRRSRQVLEVARASTAARLERSPVRLEARHLLHPRRT